MSTLILYNCNNQCGNLQEHTLGCDYHLLLTEEHSTYFQSQWWFPPAHGNLMNFGSKCFTMDSQVECTTTFTVDLATPNKCPIVRYAAGVAKFKRVIASLCSPDIGGCKRVCCLWMKNRSWSQGYLNVVYQCEVLQPNTCCESDHMLPPMSWPVSNPLCTWPKNSSWVDKKLYQGISLPITGYRWWKWNKTARSLTKNEIVCHNRLDSWLERELHTILQQVVLYNDIHKFSWHL